jgi:hypothetical protein
MRDTQRLLQNFKDEEPLLREIQARGFPVESIAELRGTPFSSAWDYEELIPVLVKWLPLIDNLDIKEDIVRTIAIPQWARPQAIQPIIDEILSKPSGQNLQFALGNSLMILVNKPLIPDYIDTLEKIVLNPDYGMARSSIAEALWKFPPERAKNILLQLINPKAQNIKPGSNWPNDDTRYQAFRSIKRMKPEDASGEIEKLINEARDYPFPNPHYQEVLDDALKALR